MSKVEVDSLDIGKLSISSVDVCKPCEEDSGKSGVKNISLKVVKKKKGGVDVGIGEGVDVVREGKNLLEVGVMNEGEEVKKKSSGTKCEHGKHRYYCTPSTYCVHSRRKSICLECGTGNQVCIHKNIKTSCALCCGGQTCPHKSKKRYCQICSPKNFCIHNKLAFRCRLCKGRAYYVHEKRKEGCVKCNGKSTCSHLKIRSRCIDCNTCIHKKIPSSCVLCFKQIICKHEILKSECNECCPANFKKCEHGISSSILMLLKTQLLPKVHHNHLLLYNRLCILSYELHLKCRLHRLLYCSKVKLAYRLSLYYNFHLLLYLL